MLNFDETNGLRRILTFDNHKLRNIMKKLAMGIDIGGTNTAFGLVDEEGTIFCER